MWVKSHRTHLFNLMNLESKSVLVLDRSWQVANVTTPKKALTDMAKGTVTALLCRDEYDFQPTTWEDWIKLPVSEIDECVHTSRQLVRLPTIVVAANFKNASAIKRMPRIRPREVMERYGGRCAYTGKLVGRKGNIDHVNPRSRGGANAWENVVWCDKEVNHKKADRRPEEAGLPRPNIRQVNPMPLVCTVEPREDRPEWKPFLRVRGT